MTIATVAVAITGAVAGVVAPVYAHPTISRLQRVS